MVWLSIRSWDRSSLARLQSQLSRELDQALPPGTASLLDIGCGRLSPFESIVGRIPLSVGVDMIAHEPKDQWELSTIPTPRRRTLGPDLVDR